MSSQPQCVDEALSCIDKVVEDDMNLVLDSIPDDGEIRAALFQMHPNKAPGPACQRE